MNIHDIKTKLGLDEIAFSETIDQESGEVTEWGRYWHNDSRTSVSIHKDTLAALLDPKSGRQNDLELKTQIKVADKGEYTSHILFMYNNDKVIAKF